LTQAGAAAGFGVGLRMYRYYERGEREGGRTVEIPKAFELAADELESRRERLAATIINKDTLEEILTIIGKHLLEPTPSASSVPRRRYSMATPNGRRQTSSRRLRRGARGLSGRQAPQDRRLASGRRQVRHDG
jgi:hypothetical protein